jgi:enediyne biosynthesis protein E4
VKFNSRGKSILPCTLAVCCLAASIAILLFAAPPAATQTQDSSASPAEFTDITNSAGIHFTHFKGSEGVSINLEEFGPGVCVSDYDKDGWQDIYFVNGRDRYNRGITVKNALYRNNGDGTFSDVTDAAGVPGTNFGLGCVWGDYDNDGFPDLFVMQFGANVLYHNNGDGTFTDVTNKAGVAGLESGSFHAGAVFFDYDRDGKLDLYVGSYVALGPNFRRYCEIADGVKSSCAPQAYSGSLNALYHNNGDGTFTNVTKSSKVVQPDGKNLAAGAFDWNNTGWPDLFVANDGQPAYLFQNLHNGKFQEIAETAGMAFDKHGHSMASMCISLGDFDNDGWLDLYISDFQENSDHVWHNSGQGYFDEVSDAAGITRPTKNVLSFGGGFFDYDNDGWLDLFIGNGHVYPEIERISDTLYKQHNTLFHNETHGKFAEASTPGGLNSLPRRAARGVAFADFDNDGFVDVLVANNGDPPTLLHNNALHKNHFVNFKLVGTKSNRDALGARIKITAGGINQIREIVSGGSYLSQSDLRANFGLADATVISSVDIIWPSGAHQSFQNVPADHFYQITEGRSQLSPQPITGFRP